MVLTYMSPSWFFGIDVGLEFLFAIVTLIVSIFSFKIYRETGFRSIKFFGISFILISISYFIQSILNFLIVSKLNQNICNMIKIQSTNYFESIGILVHIFFMTLGLSILLYTTLKDKRIKVLWLLIILSLTAIFLNPNYLNMFYLISSVLLGFISWHYIVNYLKNKQTKTLFVAIGFLFLLFGSFHFLVAVNHELFYAIGHILELFAYVLILSNLYLVRRK